MFEAVAYPITGTRTDQPSVIERTHIVVDQPRAAYWSNLRCLCAIEDRTKARDAVTFHEIFVDNICRTKSQLRTRGRIVVDTNDQGPLAGALAGQG